MLVLGRKENQSIIIGQNIRVTIVGRSGSSIRIGVQAPGDVRIVREELAGRADESAKRLAGDRPAPAKQPGRRAAEHKREEGAPPAEQSDWLLGSLPPAMLPRKAAG